MKSSVVFFQKQIGKWLRNSLKTFPYFLCFRRRGNSKKSTPPNNTKIASKFCPDGLFDTYIEAWVHILSFVFDIQKGPRFCDQDSNTTWVINSKSSEKSMWGHYFSETVTKHANSKKFSMMEARNNTSTQRVNPSYSG